MIEIREFEATENNESLLQAPKYLDWKTAMVKFEFEIKSLLDWNNLNIPRSSLKLQVNVDPVLSAKEQLIKETELL